MNKAFIAAIGLIIAHAATELWQLVWAIWPKSVNATVNYFLDQKAMPNGISLLWWIKMFTDEVLICYVFYDYAMTALRTSRKKFAVVFSFFVYHVFDGVMFLYNFKQAQWIYWVMLGFDLTAIIILFMPIKERAKIINLD